MAYAPSCLNDKDDNMTEQRYIASRWGDSELDDRYYVRMPGWMLFNLRWFVNVGYRTTTDSYKLATGENQYELTPSENFGKIVGITPTERELMLTIMAFKFDSPNTLGARPSVGLLAHILGVSERTVQHHKRSLIEKGALLVEHDSYRNDTDTYIFAEVARQCRLFESFWREHGLANPTQYEKREEFATGRGEEIFTAWWGEEIFTAGGEEIFTQRSRILRLQKGDETINIVSSALPPSIHTTDDSKDESPDDSDGTQASSETKPPKSKFPKPKKATGKRGKRSTKKSTDKSSALPPEGGKKPGTRRPAAQKIDDKEGAEEKRVRLAGIRAEIADWTKQLLKHGTGNDAPFRGYHTPDEIKHTNKFFGRELKVAGLMREAVIDFQRVYPQIDISDLTPDSILQDYLGIPTARTGWLFTVKFRNAELTTSVQAYARHFMEYLYSSQSVMGQRIAGLDHATLQKKIEQAERISNQLPQNDSDFDAWYARYLELRAENEAENNESSPDA